MITRLLSRRAALLVVAAAMLAFLDGRLDSQTSQSLSIVSRDARRPLVVTTVNDQEFVALDDLAATFQLAVREEGGAITVSYKGKTIVLSTDQTIASVAGRMISLPARPVRSGGRVLVPLDFINRAVASVYDARVELRRGSRLLVIGDVRVPRVTIVADTQSASARLTIDIAPPQSPTLTQEGDHLTLRFEADALDVVLPAVQAHDFVRGLRRLDGTAIAIDVGARYGSYRSSVETQDARTHLTLDLLPARTETSAAPAAPAPAAPAPEAPPPPPVDLPAFGRPRSAVRTVTLDAGHGGSDAGVKGDGGLLEKQLTLSVARRLKATLESRIGVRVLMTRDDDRDVSFDSRSALSNNNKADLFISLHANASFRPAAAGASVLVSSFPDEAEVRRSLSPVRVPVFGGGLRDIEIVTWNQAQIRFIEQSDLFARTLVETLQGRVPLDTRPTGRAPLRVLASANMPAVLLELGYLTNPEQERLLGGNEYQQTFVEAIVDAVVLFRDRLTHAGGGER